MSGGSSPDDRDLLAAELALGLLDGPERADGEALLAADPGFAAAHLRWQHWAADLIAGGDEAPPASVWPAILARLPANDRSRSAPAGTLRRWQALAAALAIVAVGLAVLPRPATRPSTVATVVRPAAPPLVAILSGDRQPGVVAVSIDPGLRRMAVRADALDPGAGEAELWVVPATGAPRAIGLIATGGRRALPLATALLPTLTPGATLAVSLEPRGGSPTGLPTGPVVLTGKIVRS